MSKQCYKCKTTKRASEFSKNSARPDGLNTYCKPCSKEISKRDRLKRAEGAVASVKTEEINPTACHNARMIRERIMGGKKVRGLGFNDCFVSHDRGTGVYKMPEVRE